jgi:uncharacterized repeat protein (TIGR03806 family)
MSWNQHTWAVGSLISLGGLLMAACSEPPIPPSVEPHDALSDAETMLDGADMLPDGVNVPVELPPVVFDINAKPGKSLNATHLLHWDGQSFQYNNAVIPYELNIPLFSDYALKARAIYIPEGQSAQYNESDVLEFPVGTIIIKSFIFPSDVRFPDKDLRLLETRLLVLSDSGWKAWPFVWADDGSDATLHVGGKVLDIDFTDFDGAVRHANYLIPQRNQCSKCHKNKNEEGVGRIVPIGPKARHLNRNYPYPTGSSNQLSHLATRGKLTGLPELDTVPASFDATDFEELNVGSLDDATIEKAARDYLDINCAHCHNPKAANGETSQLFLNIENQDEFHLGICKLPGSAGKGGFGRTYNIVPGAPNESILMYRTETEITGAMMPDLGRSLQHNAGAALLYEWILRMPPVSCTDDD